MRVFVAVLMAAGCTVANPNVLPNGDADGVGAPDLLHTVSPDGGGASDGSQGGDGGGAVDGGGQDGAQGCGGNLQPCCSSSSCSAGFVCVKTDGTRPELCAPCGGEGQDCCPGSACGDSSLSCRFTGDNGGFVRSICEACGHQGQPCCQEWTDAGASTGQGTTCVDGTTCGTHSHFCGCGDYLMDCCPAGTLGGTGCAPGQGACSPAGCGV